MFARSKIIKYAETGVILAISFFTALSLETNVFFWIPSITLTAVLVYFHRDKFHNIRNYICLALEVVTAILFIINVSSKNREINCSTIPELTELRVIGKLPEYSYRMRITNAGMGPEAELYIDKFLGIRREDDGNYSVLLKYEACETYPGSMSSNIRCKDPEFEFLNAFTFEDLFDQNYIGITHIYIQKSFPLLETMVSLDEVYMIHNETLVSVGYHRYYFSDVIRLLSKTISSTELADFFNQVNSSSQLVTNEFQSVYQYYQSNTQVKCSALGSKIHYTISSYNITEDSFEMHSTRLPGVFASTWIQFILVSFYLWLFESRFPEPSEDSAQNSSGNTNQDKVTQVTAITPKLHV